MLPTSILTVLSYGVCDPTPFTPHPIPVTASRTRLMWEPEWMAEEPEDPGLG